MMKTIRIIDEKDIILYEEEITLLTYPVIVHAISEIIELDLKGDCE